MRTATIQAVVFASTLFAACAVSQPRPIPRYTEQVDAAFTAAADGEYQRAVGEAEAVLHLADPRTPEGAQDFFRAALAAADAHVRAAQAAPFLLEPAAAGVRLPSKTAHWVAATRYFGIARSVAPRAATTENAAEIGKALRDANLVELSLHSRLGLAPSIRAFLARTPELQDSKACVSAAMQAPLAGSRPWVYLALFDYQRERDQRQAYRFAVLTLDEAPSAGDALDPHRLAELENWILRESTLEFHCPKCDLAVSPALHACPSDRTPNVEFVGRKRL